MKTAMGVLVPSLLLLGWLIWFRPLELGGPATYVSVTGISMEPALYAGDLVVLRQHDSYQTGDVVAYRSSQGYVIHRIVGGNARDGYIVQGDNRNEPDRLFPRPDQIAGEMWIHVPNGGEWINRLREPQTFGYVVVALCALGGVGLGSHELRRRRGRRRRFAMRVPRRTLGSGGSWRPDVSGLRGLAFAGTAIGIVLVVLFGAVALTAFRQPAERTVYVEELAYQHVASLDYGVSMTPSLLYPNGIYVPSSSPLEAEAFDVSPGATSTAAALNRDSFATQLAREIAVVVDYTLESPVLAVPAAAASDVVGTIAVQLEIRAGKEGWVQERQLQPLTAFSGTTAQAVVRIDLAEITALIEQIEEETLIKPGDYELRVLPTVRLIGNLNGRRVDELFKPVFIFEYDTAQVRTGPRVVRGEPMSIGENVTTERQLSLLGVELPVPQARSFGSVAAAVAAFLVVACGCVLLMGVGLDEDRRIHARYRSRLLAVKSTRPEMKATTVRVTSIHDLARIAEMAGVLILCEQTRSGHRYFVKDGDEIYEYETATARGNAARGRLVESP